MSFITREFKPYFERSINPLINFLSQKEVHPNTITLTGLLLIGVGSITLYLSMEIVALVLLSTGALLDAVDGAVARKKGIESEYGAFLDSTIDRVSDALPFVALGFHYAEKGDQLNTLLSLLAIVSSFLVSYARAKAESLGIYGLGGIFERTERWIVLIIGLASGFIEIALLFIIIGSTATVVQRIAEVRKNLLRRHI